MTMIKILKTLRNAEKSDNDNIYQKLQLMANLAVIKVLFK